MLVFFVRKERGDHLEIGCELVGSNVLVEWERTVFKGKVG